VIKQTPLLASPSAPLPQETQQRPRETTVRTVAAFALIWFLRTLLPHQYVVLDPGERADAGEGVVGGFDEMEKLLVGVG
jgi:hypothetical protein